MKKHTLALLVTVCFLSCMGGNKNYKMQFLTEKIPWDAPIAFKKDLTPQGQLIHKGIFSPDLEAYYYTLSDPDFQTFDVYVVKKHQGTWGPPQQAFFNSQYNEHGMSFTPDGKSIYFSSTRPTHTEGVLDTWHIWKADQVNGKWSEPSFVDIPNLRSKLVSHPSLSNSGTLYFHVSNLDYSEMDIYRSQWVNGKFTEAKKVSISMNSKSGKCTPYVSPDEDYLIFASIENELDLMVSFHDGRGGWGHTKKLSHKINTKGQGNPYVTPDNKFLFFTTGDAQQKDWRVKWVHIESELNRN